MECDQVLALDVVDGGVFRDARIRALISLNKLVELTVSDLSYLIVPTGDAAFLLDLCQIDLVLVEFRVHQEVS